MFEDSLMESAGRIRTKNKWTALGSLSLQAAVLAILLLLPLLHPEALPKQAMARLLVAPPPPPSPPAPPVPTNASAAARQVQIIDSFAAPRRIPDRVAMNVSDPPPPSFGPADLGSGSRLGIPGSLDEIGRSIPTPTMRPSPPKGPVRVSSGVAAGQLLHPITAQYPSMAKATRTQGTVVVEATISRGGTIENAHVVSGPPMLQTAALEAIRSAHYRPFLLNGEPVEIQTTISVIFSLGGGS